ncbi:Protein N-acetyltransferase, RimJ/RimL family [Jatrophihabitans endophyticus]|uniref:Lysine N-acyltransferase MbtK n=1 Tax=Jatrophihabitans endophyticus TaxID=1206085 RepID=A0A1M5SVA8_9ACTN|nr:GNAT family N-acetyltransferase [Jatrophihabitans endophyticus]SHH42501.1 Protein N-acetyltransferase, RimJ/RimL family [Jatrophihabitans endophyticus]
MIVLRPFDPDRDTGLVHDWLTRPYAHFWDMLDATPQQVRDGYVAMAADPHQDAWIGERDGRAVLLAETYDPAHGELAGHYDTQDGDLGMHFLTAPPVGPPEHGFTRAVIRAVMAHCFAAPEVLRVVVEPDVRNAAVHALNEAVGFRALGEVQLHDKRALLSVCTRADFEAAVEGVPA